jgi:hypothetical protein
MKKVARYKDMKTKIALAAMALAVVCLSMAPALSAGWDSNNKDRCNASFQRGGFDGPNNWMLLVDDATRENFDNMTLNQIKQLREAKNAQLNNMTLAQIDELRQKQMDKLNNMTLAQIREMKMDWLGEMGPGMMRDGMMSQGMMSHGMHSGMAENGQRSGSQPRGGR